MRKRLKPQWKTKSDSGIRERLFRLKEFKKAKVIFLYVSKADEVDTIKILERLIKLKKIIVVPRVEGKHIRLHTIEHFEHLTKGNFGIFEPKKHRPKINPKHIDIALVPGIAFDKTGSRIGYGHGYFDRLLKKMTCPKIGLAYDFQMVAKIETHVYDVPVDDVVTEKRTIRTNR